MSFTITIDGLRKYQSTVSQCKREALLRSSPQINTVKSDIEDVMAEVDAPCLVAFSPHLEENSLNVSCQWIGEESAGDGWSNDDFFKFAVINSLLEYTGVIAV